MNISPLVALKPCNCKLQKWNKIWNHTWVRDSICRSSYLAWICALPSAWPPHQGRLIWTPRSRPPTQYTQHWLNPRAARAETAKAGSVPIPEQRAGCWPRSEADTDLWQQTRPWVGEAIEARQVYFSITATDCLLLCPHVWFYTGNLPL